jgi:hypothetical protein
MEIEDESVQIEMSRPSLEYIKLKPL